MKVFITALLLMFLSSASRAQDESFQTWLDYRTSYWFTPEWEYFGDYGLRGVLNVENWNQFYINPAVHWMKTKDLNFTGGMRFIYTDQEPESNKLELRPWQGVRYYWPRLRYLTFDHYVRLEERLIWELQGGGFSFSARARYRIQMKTANFKLPLIPTNFFFVTAFELFGDLGEVIVENYVGTNRIFFALGNHITSKTQLELHFILQRSKKSSTEDFESNDKVLRFRIRQNFN